MTLITNAAAYAVPLFLIASPMMSYADQAISMYRSKSSAGFSLDIPLIMLVASIFRIFYYPGARFDTALLIQAFCMIATMAVLLKIALDYRPPPSSKGGEAAVPFSGVQNQSWLNNRPYNFWQWRSPKPYWQFLLSLFIVLTVLELIIAPFKSIYPAYSALVGYIGLSVEATLPLPQLISNAQLRSCKGFRVSVLGSWLLGDAMKMFWFFTATTEIPWAFKMCGIFQAFCDVGLGIQYLMYGDHDPIMKMQPTWPYAAGAKPHLPFDGHGRLTSSGRNTPTGWHTQAGEKVM